MNKTPCKGCIGCNENIILRDDQQASSTVIPSFDEKCDDDYQNENPEEYEPKVEFKPIVKIEEVEARTGEEDEDIVFKSRCKLYRFNSEIKEWKEKGVGEIKILKHKVNSNSYRVVMRRDQLFKLCANHRILPEIKLEIVNEKQVRWMASDYSNGKVNFECLTAKFRHQDEAKQFKDEFEKAQRANNNNPTQTIDNLSSLPITLPKVTIGSWNFCDSCLTSNKPDAKKCTSCDQVKVDENLANNDNGKRIFKLSII